MAGRQAGPHSKRLLSTTYSDLVSLEIAHTLGRLEADQMELLMSDFRSAALTHVFLHS